MLVLVILTENDFFSMKISGRPEIRPVNPAFVFIRHLTEYRI
jgi:hypothetical protein